MVMAHSLLNPLVPATVFVPDIMETAGLAGFGMTRGVGNETRDTTMRFHRLTTQVKPVVRVPRKSEDE